MVCNKALAFSLGTIRQSKLRTFPKQQQDCLWVSVHSAVLWAQSMFFTIHACIPVKQNCSHNKSRTITRAMPGKRICRSSKRCCGQSLTPAIKVVKLFHILGVCQRSALCKQKLCIVGHKFQPPKAGQGQHKWWRSYCTGAYIAAAIQRQWVLLHHVC